MTQDYEIEKFQKIPVLEKIIYLCNVKGFTIFLSLYVLILVLMPCFDNELHKDVSMANIDQLFDGNHLEICSPLCSDHDCHTHITVSFISTTFIQTQFDDLVKTERPVAIPTPYFAIWQPPKIG